MSTKNSRLAEYSRYLILAGIFSSLPRVGLMHKNSPEKVKIERRSIADPGKWFSVVSPIARGRCQSSMRVPCASKGDQLPSEARPQIGPLEVFLLQRWMKKILLSRP